MTTFWAFSGSTAMDGDVYVRAGSTSPFVVWTGWVSRSPAGAAATAPALSMASSEPVSPAVAILRRTTVRGFLQTRANIIAAPRPRRG